MNHDANLYLEAMKEVDSDQRDEAIWAKALTLCKGDQEASRFKYIELKVSLLQAAKDSNAPSMTDKAAETIKSTVINVANNLTEPKGRQLSNIEDADLIEKIKSGEAKGRVRDGIWYLNEEPRDRVSGETFTPSTNTASPTMQELASKLLKKTPAEAFANAHGFSPEEVIFAIKDGTLRGRLISGDWHVEVGTEFTPSVSKKRSSHSGERTHIKKLISGEYGLAKTYWLFGVVIGFLASVLLQILGAVGAPGGLLGIFGFVAISYNCAVLKGIWKAADQYRGPQLWAVLGKVAVVLGALQIVALIFIFIGIASL